jgi:predicted P-loop ATPase
LRDETGGRRFWPVKVGIIDIEALIRDRDQLFAEAVQLFRNGAQWWPDKEFEAEQTKPEQDDRYEADAWEGEISKHLVGKAKTTVSELSRALYIDTPRLGTGEQRRIAAALEHLGWARGERAHGGVRLWVPKPPKW